MDRSGESKKVVDQLKLKAITFLFSDDTLSDEQKMMVWEYTGSESRELVIAMHYEPVIHQTVLRICLEQKAAAEKQQNG